MFSPVTLSGKNFKFLRPCDTEKRHQSSFLCGLGDLCGENTIRMPKAYTDIYATLGLTSPLDMRGDLNNAATAAKSEPRKPRFSLFDILRFISGRNDR